MHRSQLFRILQNTDEGDHSIIEMLQKLKILNNCEQCMSKYRASVKDIRKGKKEGGRELRGG